jgi:hypothetical protein
MLAISETAVQRKFAAVRSWCALRSVRENAAFTFATITPLLLARAATSLRVGNLLRVRFPPKIAVRLRPIADIEPECDSCVMDRLWLRMSAVLAIWLLASVALFQATVQFPSIFSSGLFYILCGACGALGLLVGKVDRVAQLMSAPLLAVGSFIIVSVLRLGYFGL